MTAEEIAAGYCPNCNCDMCQAASDRKSVERALKAGTEAHCWKCSTCGWIGCYDADTFAEYGTPDECNRCCSERLSEVEPHRVAPIYGLQYPAPVRAILESNHDRA